MIVWIKPYSIIQNHSLICCSIARSIELKNSNCIQWYFACWNPALLSHIFKVTEKSAKGQSDFGWLVQRYFTMKYSSSYFVNLLTSNDFRSAIFLQTFTSKMANCVFLAINSPDILLMINSSYILLVYIWFMNLWTVNMITVTFSRLVNIHFFILFFVPNSIQIRPFHPQWFRLLLWLPCF